MKNKEEVKKWVIQNLPYKSYKNWYKQIDESYKHTIDGFIDFTDDIAEKLYCFINDINSSQEIPKCKNCNCNSKFYRIKYGYYNFCCKECRIEYRKNNEMQKKYYARYVHEIDWLKNVSIEKYAIYLKEWIKSNLIGNTGKIISVRIQKKWFVYYGYINYYNEIINRTKYLDENCKFSERIFHILNDLYCCKTCSNNCTNLVDFITFQYGYNTYCSIKCSSSSKEFKNKVKNTCKRKYGVEHIFQSEKYKEKFKKTNMEKYGVEYPSQLKEIQLKCKKTNLLRHGSESSLGNDKAKKKFANTCMERYSVDHPAKSKEFQDVRKNTCMKKYGTENPLQSNTIREKADISNIKKYETKYPSQSKIIKEKIKNTCLEKYNVLWPIQRNISKESYCKLNNKEWLIQEYKNKNGEIISKELDVSARTIYNYLRVHDINIDYSYSSSFNEDEIVDFINTENIKTNTRKIISPLELDIYIPDYSLAIEFNGLYWHSYKSKNYHLNKTEMCQEKDIQLLHVFENEWLDITKKDIWKSIINSKLSRNKRIFARNTEIKEIIDNKIVKEFLDNNHLQGFIGSSVKLGLFYNNKLISIMTFGKTRFSKKYEWEMIRFCNKKFTTVIGGASKLYKYFVDNYKPKSIISYADRRYSDGNLYKQLGFKFSHYSSPNYWYFKNGLNLYSRVRFQKHKLSSLLEVFDSNKSEIENMLENGYKRIFDCGNMVYTFTF